MNLEKRFTDIYENNEWGSFVTPSGPGSEIRATRNAVKALRDVIKIHHISSMLDVGCGDFSWIKEILDFTPVWYRGVDIVQPLIDKNVYGPDPVGGMFYKACFICEPLPKVSLIFCRQALQHLAWTNVVLAIDNFKRSGSKWLLATTFANDYSGPSTDDGGFFPYNLEDSELELGVPEETWPESEYSGAYEQLGLWRLQ